MRAGRELDCLVHREVFGHRWAQFNPEVNIITVPAYSTDIAAAWEVVEALCACPERNFLLERNGAYLAGFSGAVFIGGGTAPVAICRAALKAKGVKYESDV